MLTAKSRTRKPTLLSQTGVGRITRSQSRLLSESEDTREILNQGRKRKRSTHSNGLGKAIEQGPGSEQSTKARRIVQEDIDALSKIPEDIELFNSNSSVVGDEDDSHSHGHLQQDSGPPGASSSDSVVTAQTSHSAQQLIDLDNELIIDMLPSLSIASTKVLDLLAPVNATAVDIQKLSEQLKNSDSRINIRLRALRGAFESSRPTYGTDHYINISLINQALYGVQDLRSSQEDLSRPDPVLQKANLVTLAITILTSTASSENGPTLQQLDGCFPRPFLSSLASTSRSISRPPAGSNLLHETFEVGLEIRTRLALALLDIHQEESNYHPEWIITQLFFEDPDEASCHSPALDNSLHAKKIRGWGVPGLGMADLSAEMKDKVIQRVNSIFSHIHRKPGADKYVDFEALDSLFPWSTFVSKVIMWARLRTNEIERYLRSSGGAESIENALKPIVRGQSPSEDINVDVAQDIILQKELQTHSSQVLEEPSNKPTRGDMELKGHAKVDGQIVAAPSPKRFDSPNAVAHLKRLEARLSARQSMRSLVRPTTPNDQPSPDDGIAVTASPSNPPGISTSETRFRDRSIPSSSNQVQEDMGGQRSNDRVPQDVDEDDRPYLNQAVALQLPPDSSAGVLRSLSRQHREQEKENLYSEADAVPRKRARFFNETQENAERINFDDSESDEQTSRLVERARKRPRTQDAGDDAETEAEFQSDDRVADENRRDTSRLRPAGGGIAHNQSRGQSGRRLGDDVTRQDQTRPGGELSDTEAVTDENTGDRINHGWVNRVAKSTVATQTTHKVQVRRPWEEAATSRLIELIENDDFGTSWAKIAKLNDPLLEGRGQVALKDKARNIKLDFLKARIALPVNFEDVRLNRNQIQILHDLGIDYQQDPERGTARF